MHTYQPHQCLQPQQESSWEYAPTFPLPITQSIATSNGHATFLLRAPDTLRRCAWKEREQQRNRTQVPKIILGLLKLPPLLNARPSTRQHKLPPAEYLIFILIVSINEAELWVDQIWHKQTHFEPKGCFVQCEDYSTCMPTMYTHSTLHAMNNTWVIVAIPQDNLFIAQRMISLFVQGSVKLAWKRIIHHMYIYMPPLLCTCVHRQSQNHFPMTTFWKLTGEKRMHYQQGTTTWWCRNDHNYIPYHIPGRDDDRFIGLARHLLLYTHIKGVSLPVDRDRQAFRQSHIT